MIIKQENGYILNTDHTTYVFSVMETGQLQHLYYGNRIDIADLKSLEEQFAVPPGNTIAYDQEHPELTLEQICMETSAYGKGDVREPMVEVVCADGSSSLDFVFQEAKISKGKEAFQTLPGSYDDENQVDHLTVIMKDNNHGFLLELHYFVYEKTDVITRTAKFINASSEDVDLKRMMSMLIDFDHSDYVVTSFHGGWTKEMKRVDTKLSGGKFVNSSFTGTSSNRSNPFIMLSREETSETAGDCYGFNLIYSGNHYEAVEVSSFDRTRVVTGINPTNFSFRLAPGEFFEAPEAVMTYSNHGYGGMSRHMHDFVNHHIVRGEWKGKERPVLLNSWEASYFNISESKLLKLAKEGKKVGIELFVMDDGWFGERNKDDKALGDWTPNEKKLPHGVAGLAKKINALGLDFGIWIEPEMVNVDSDLYRAHPEWSIEIPGKNHSEGRNQRLLDYCNPEVVSYMTEQMSQLFLSANIAYVKWDMNRIFSDYYSQYLDETRQQEVTHRYVMGLYQMMETLTQRFPHILFEGCAAGGNRFDLGILCYFPQIWGSDNSDSVSRLSIQNGYSYGYPMSTVTAHVSSCPNHQTLRVTPLYSRFHVAAFGVLGYECNLCDMSNEDKKEIAKQIEWYKNNRALLQYGDFYRCKEGNHVQWMCVSKDKTKAVGMLYQKLVQPNEQHHMFFAKGLDEKKLYHFTTEKMDFDVRVIGDLINAVLPIHIKQDGLLHTILSKVKRLGGENENHIMYGNALMNAGVELKQAFVSTGYVEGEMRYFADFASRFYFMKEVEPDTKELQ